MLQCSASRGVPEMAGKPVGAVLVVGGGIAGMQASLDLADSGFKVYLLDSAPTIGGRMAQLDKTFPTNDCAMCIMAPKLVGTGRHQNIELITNATLDELKGEEGNFTAVVTRGVRRVNEEKCTGCGICAQKCPVEVPDEYNQGMKPRKAIYVSYAQAVPLVFKIDQDACIGCGVCEGECKANAIEYDQKAETLELNVGSVILAPGYEPYDPSEKQEYGYGVFPNVVSSMDMERMLSATGPYWGQVFRPSDGRIPKNVAFIQCVGSRDEKAGAEYCSAVCCMYGLKEAIIASEHQKGLKPHMFYMDLRTYGKEFEQYYHRARDEHGIEFHRGRVASVTEDPKTGNLRVAYAEGEEFTELEFDMVVLSTGLRPPKDAEALAKATGVELDPTGFCATKPGSSLETSRAGVFIAGAFSGPKDIPDSVAQASGAAAKAESVVAPARNTLVTPVEYPQELEVAEQEPRIGVFVCHCGINIAGVVDVTAVKEYAATLPNVEYVDQNLYTCSQDAQELIKKAINEHKLNRVIVASCTPRTHEPLFQNTIREAGLNPFLFEMANIRDQCSWIHSNEPEAATEKSKDLVRMAVAKSRLLEPLGRSELPVSQSALVIGGGPAGMTAALELAKQDIPVHLVERTKELGGHLAQMRTKFNGTDPKAMLDSMVKEVKGNKNITLYLGAEITELEGFIGNYKSTIEGKEVEHGAIIVTTGGDEYIPDALPATANPGKPMPIADLGDKVVTQTRFEQLLADGKFKGGTVAVLQCVGSRDEERPYCSRVCCTTAVKNALAIKEKQPDTNVYILYRDMRTYGLGEQDLKKAANMGVTMLRFEDGDYPAVTAGKDGLKVQVNDEILGPVSLAADLLVLSTGASPAGGTEDLAQMLKVPTSKDGFFLEAHMKLRPLDFSTDGVFLAGTAHSPKSLEESIAQAAGAASRAATILSKSTLESEGIIAMVNEDICDGCGICEPICEYKAIEIVADPKNAEKKLAEINEGLCKGCGACVGACPSGAMEQKGFKDDQMLAVIDAALSSEVRT